MQRFTVFSINSAEYIIFPSQSYSIRYISYLAVEDVEEVGLELVYNAQKVVVGLYYRLKTQKGSVLSSL